jgi:hypothetical protein
MTVGLLLAAALAQTPDEMEKDAEAPLIAWANAVASLRDPDQADKAVESFREAARAWKHQRNKYGEWPRTLLWLGYSHHAAGDLPQAIAAYRRGLALDKPYSEFETAKLRTALDYARDLVAYPPGAAFRPAPDLWPPWLSLRYVGAYAFALYFAGCLAATRWQMTRRRRWLVAAGVLLAVAAVPAVGSAVEWQRRRRDAAAPVVVVTRDVPLRTGNGADYPAKLDLPRGCEVRRLFERGGWLQVETAGGTVGWVPRAAVVD